MCTDSCPCPIDLNFSMWEEAALNKFGRTKFTNQSGTTYAPMVFAPDFNTASFNNFHQCYDMLSKRPGFHESNLIHQGVIDLIESLESEYDCNGVCETGIFFFFKPMYAGPPTTTCFEGIKSFFSLRFLSLGIIIGVSFLLTFVTFFTSCFMCCRAGKDGEEDSDEEGEEGGKSGKPAKEIVIEFKKTEVASIDGFCDTVKEVLDQFKGIAGTLGD